MHDLYHGPYPVDMTPEEARTELAQQNVAKTDEALVREAERADQWQDISTAPKHTLCLLFEPHDDGGFCFVGCTNMDGDWVNNLDLQVQHPTLWSPLDAPGEHTQESQP